MNLKEIKSLSEISVETGIKQDTLKRRVYRLIEEDKLKEYQHYKKLGEGKRTYIFNEKGAEIILGGKENGIKRESKEKKI